MGRLSRTKGAAYEREIVRRLKDIGIDAARNLTETRDGNCGDIVTPTLPITWQCKVGARPPIYEAVEEAYAAAKPGHHPVAVVRRNRLGRNAPVDLAVLPLDDFLELIALLRSCGAWR